jgi:hypothetical protein
MARTFGHEDAVRATGEALQHIVRTLPIDAFLQASSAKRYVVGPKGSGKSLILRRKAIDKRQEESGLCIPSNSQVPVDLLTSTWHIGRRFTQKWRNESDNHLAWSSIWKNAILRSILHHTWNIIVDSTARNAPSMNNPGWLKEYQYQQMVSLRESISKLLDPRAVLPKRPFEYYADLCNRLDKSPGDIHEVRHDNSQLEHIIDLYDSPVYVFLDNLDDYYEHDPALWTQSMYGLLRAIREVSDLHKHIHVYTSIRSDVFCQFSDEMLLQYRDFVVRLEYSRDELLAVFESGVRQLDDNLLHYPAARNANPWRAFFGDIRTIHNVAVGVEEPIQQYILRHTLWRPRDLIHIGTELLDKRQQYGFTEQIVRDAVAVASTGIAEQYLNEIRPLIDPRLDLRDFITSTFNSSVISRKSLEAVRNKLNAAWDVSAMNQTISSLEVRQLQIADPFEALYAVGLLGYSETPIGSVDAIQGFRLPGDLPKDFVDKVIPESNEYFLHPCLVGLLNPKRSRVGVVIGKDLLYRRTKVEHG